MGGGDRDLKVEAIRGGVRDLKIDAAAAVRGGLKMEAAAMGGGDRGLEAAAMEGGDLNLKLHSVAIGEGFHELWIGEGDRDLKTKMNDAGWSEGGDTLKTRKPWEEVGGILKLKKEMLTAMDLWFGTNRQILNRQILKEGQEKAEQMMMEFGATTDKAQEKAQSQQALGARKKKMKVVRTKFSKEFIDHVATFTFGPICKDMPEELFQRKPYMRKVYAAVKIYEAKRGEYWDALVAQQRELGYAEDEIEVTDDEEEEAVVKN